MFRSRRGVRQGFNLIFSVVNSFLCRTTGPHTPSSITMWRRDGLVIPMGHFTRKCKIKTLKSLWCLLIKGSYKARLCFSTNQHEIMIDPTCFCGSITNESHEKCKPYQKDKIIYLRVLFNLIHSV